MHADEYRTLARQSFGDDYVDEIARHYRITTRAVRYYNGKTGPSWDVANDLRRWSEPDGWLERMKAKVDRELQDSIPSELKISGLRHLIGRLQKDLVRAEKEAATSREARQRWRDQDEAERQIKEFEDGCRLDAIMVEMTGPYPLLPPEPIRALLPLEATVIEFTALSWDP